MVGVETRNEQQTPSVLVGPWVGSWVSRHLLETLALAWSIRVKGAAHVELLKVVVDGSLTSMAPGHKRLFVARDALVHPRRLGLSAWCFTL